MYIVVKARIKDLEAQMFIIEQFSDDYTLNVTKEGYMFLTVKQAIEFLKNVDEDKVSEEGYLRLLIEKKRLEIARRHSSVRNGMGNLTTNRQISSDMSFNILSNPIDKNQSLVMV